VASRPRSSKRRGWPEGLYERAGYFSWRNPITGVEMGIGRVPLGEAKAQAAEANIHVRGLADRPRLLDRLEGREDTTWRAWLLLYEQKLGVVASAEHAPDAPLAKNTEKAYRAQIKRIREVWQDQLELPVSRISTRMIADGLDTIRKKTPRMAQTVRSRLLHCFDAAASAGWLTTANPVTVTGEVAAPVRRARLTWEVFQQLYASMPAGRLKNATALALVSGQARETVCGGRFDQLGTVTPPGGQPVECWLVTRGKTGAKIAIPLDLRLHVFGSSLRDVIRQCRSTGVASRYLVHSTEHGKGYRRGAKYNMNRLTMEFTAAVLELGLEWGDKTPPTFHELRSLSKRLYAAQGGVNTLDLLGHADEKTGQMYADERGSEYRLVSLQLQK
jgi:hypothetical protein